VTDHPFFAKKEAADRPANPAPITNALFEVGGQYRRNM